MSAPLKGLPIFLLASYAIAAAQILPFAGLFLAGDTRLRMWGWTLLSTAMAVGWLTLLVVGFRKFGWHVLYIFPGAPVAVLPPTQMLLVVVACTWGACI